jgi:hypothetical protein
VPKGTGTLSRVIGRLRRGQQPGPGGRTA